MWFAGRYLGRYSHEYARGDGIVFAPSARPNSVIAFHLSSTSIDLRPVVQSLANFYHLASVEVDTLTDLQPMWVLVARNPATLRSPELSAKSHEVEVKKAVRLWTDNYSSPYEILNW